MFIFCDVLVVPCVYLVIAIKSHPNWLCLNFSTSEIHDFMLKCFRSPSLNPATCLNTSPQTVDILFLSILLLNYHYHSGTRGLYVIEHRYRRFLLCQLKNTVIQPSNIMFK